MESSNDKAKKIIFKIIYITIATVSDKGTPWNTPVYSAFDEQYNFFWASWKRNQHSQNIRHNPEIFIVIYDSNAKEGVGEGVYIKAKAYELDDTNEISHAIKYLYGRKGSKPRSVEDFLGDNPRRIYKAVPEKFWMNIASEIDGNFVDKRVEIDLRDQP